MQLLMVGSRRLGGVTNLESDKHAGKPGAFAIWADGQRHGGKIFEIIDESC